MGFSNCFDQLNDDYKKQLENSMIKYVQDEEINNYDNFINYVTNLGSVLNNYKQYGITYLGLIWLLYTGIYFKNIDNLKQEKYKAFICDNSFAYLKKEEFLEYKNLIKRKLKEKGNNNQ